MANSFVQLVKFVDRMARGSSGFASGRHWLLGDVAPQDRPQPLIGSLVGSEQVQLRRAVFSIVYRDAPASYAVVASCGNLDCLRPDHLDLRQKVGEPAAAGMKQSLAFLVRACPEFAHIVNLGFEIAERQAEAEQVEQESEVEEFEKVVA